MRRATIMFLSVLCTLAVLAAPALAVEADEAAAVAANDGFYVENGSSITPAQAGDLVSRMRDAGEGFVLVVLADEPAAGATTFADNVQFAMGRGLVLVIAPESVGFAGDGDVFNESELDSALDVAVDAGGSDFDLAATFVSRLTGTAVVAPTSPVPVPTTVAAQTPTTPQPAAGSGGGGFFLIILLVAGGLFVWWMMRRAKRKAASRAEQMHGPNLTKARYAIQEQLNDVANDILSMEDEVRDANNDRADDFFKRAGKTYNDVSEAVGETTSTEGLLNLSNKLDVAIWQLDSAEAILDDKPLPERPEPKRIEMPPTSGRPSSRTSAPPPRATVPGPSSGYQRRPTRRSSFGGGGLMDLLILVGGSMMKSQRRSTQRRTSPSRSGGGGLGDLFNRRRPPPTTPSSGSRGANPVPGPGRPATPSRRRSQVPKSSTKRGTSGRVRSGRKRRK